MNVLELINFFINKFENIPEDNWCTGAYTKSTTNNEGKLIIQCCAMGHCIIPSKYENGNSNFYKFDSDNFLLSELFGKFSYNPTYINDGKCRGFQQHTPKLRILAALNYFKGIELKK